MEIGPHPVLSAYLKEILGGFSNFSAQVTLSLKRDANEFDTIFGALAQLHTSGVAIDWKSFHSVFSPNSKLAELPLYPWQRQRYWLESDFSYNFRMGLAQSPGQQLGSHPLLTSSVIPSHDDSVFTWALSFSLGDIQTSSETTQPPSLSQSQQIHSQSQQLGPRPAPTTWPFLSHHVVHGVVLMPGVAFVEMAHKAYTHLLETKMERAPARTSAVVVKRVRFLRALSLEENTIAQIRVRVDTRHSSEEWHFEVLDESEDESNPFATGELSLRTALTKAELPESSRNDFIHSSGVTAVTGEELYNDLATKGLVYGPSFRLLRQAWQKKGSALAELVVTPAIQETLQQYAIHPCLFDCALHTMAGALNSGVRGGLIPIGMDRIFFYAKPNFETNTFWAMASLTQDDGTEISGDISLYNDDGQIIVEVFGFRVRFMDAITERDISECIITNSWQECPIPDDMQLQAKLHPRSDYYDWIIFDDGSIGTGIGKLLLEAFPNQDVKPVWVTPGKSFVQVAEDKFEINPEDAESFVKVMGPTLAKNKPVMILYLWAIRVSSLRRDTSPDEIRRGEVLSFGGALHLAQALWVLRPEVEQSESITIWCVTHGAVEVQGLPSVHPLQAPLCGLARCLMLESEGLFECFQCDLDTRTENEYEQLWNELCYVSAALGDVPNDFEIAYRRGERYANRLKRNKVTLPPDEGSDTIYLKENHYPSPEFGPWALDTAHTGSVTQWMFKKTSSSIFGNVQHEAAVIKTHACGINFKDVLIALGRLERETSYMLGLEAAGTVVSLPKGKENTLNLKVGDEVMGFVVGGLASHSLALIDVIIPKPDSWTMEEAAAVPVVFVTVYYALQYLAKLQSGNRILIHSATGGVGMAAIWYAKRVGAEIFATAGSEEKRDILRGMGINTVMDSRSLAFADTIMEITKGEGVDVVLHGGARFLTKRSLEIVADGGHFIDLGKPSEMEKLQATHQANAKANIAVSTVELQHLAFTRPKLVQRLLTEVVGILVAEKVDIKTVCGIRVVGLEEVPGAFQLMGGAQHTGKIVVRTVPPTKDEKHTETFEENASYLIVGGVRGFGLSVAEWMSSSGVKSLILVSRSGAAGVDEQGRSTIAAMEERGTRVSIFSVDVSDRDCVVNLIREIEETKLPPLRGVIQSSMVLEDCLAVKSSLPKYFRVSDPKVVGTWNLHCATLHIPLSFFLMFSSIASLVGNIAQSSYAGANLFMDNFASYRRSLNLPATTINWGVIANVGFIARNVDYFSEMLDSKGILTVLPAEAFRAIKYLLFSHFRKQSDDNLPAQVGVIRSDFMQWAEANPAFDTFLRYADLIKEDRSRREKLSPNHTAQSGSKGGSLNLFRAIEALPVHEKIAQISQYICTALARILQIEASEISINEKLSSFGVDSLMSYELRSFLLRELLLDVPVVYLLQQATVSSLVAKVVAQLATEQGESNSTQSTPPTVPPVPPIPPITPAEATISSGNTETPSGKTDAPSGKTEASSSKTETVDISVTKIENPNTKLHEQQLQPEELKPQTNGSLSASTGLENVTHKELVKEREPNLANLILRRSSTPNAGSPTSPGKSPKLRKIPPFPMGSLHQAYWIGRKGTSTVKGVSCHFYFQFEGRWDIEKLQSALGSVIIRHAALRTIVLPEGLFKILERVPVYSIQVHDLSDMDEKEANEEVAKTQERMSHQAFETDKWPLFEIRLTKLSSDRHILHIDFDHIILDMKGGFQFMTEWGVFYANPDLELPLPETTMYNYILGLEKYKQTSSQYQKSIKYWKEKAATLPNSPPLPLTKELGMINGPKFTRKLIHFAPEVWASISKAAITIGVTPSILILTAYARVLSVWSNATHFTLTVVAFNRQNVCKDFDNIMGDFTSTILLAIDASDGNLCEMARRLQEKLHTDLEHVQVSGVDVQREMAKERGRSGVQNFPVVFTSVLDRDSSIDWLGDFQASLSETPQVYMDCIAFMFQGSLHLSLDFVEEVFPPGLVATVFSAFGRLLGALHEENGIEIWANPGISHALLIPPSERMLRTQINATKADFPHVTLHQLFLLQVSRNPTASALIDSRKKETWTYQQLFEHAWLTYNRLKQNGVRNGDLVAILAKKGWEQIVSVLAVLFCGAAYLPVDITFPSARISELLSLGKVKHCLVPADHLSAFIADHPHHTTTTVVTLEEYRELPKIFPSPHDIPPGDPSQLAYVLFTSGSTGIPKGVMIEHAGAVNTVHFVLKRFSIGYTEGSNQESQGDAFLFLNALHFDLSVFDIFGALGSGSRLVIPQAEQIRDPVAISRFITSYNITVWNSVPQMLQLLLEHIHQLKSTLPSLRLVMLSGDIVRSSMPASVEACLPNALFVALGGPTEITIWSNYFVVEKGTDTSKWATVPYGFPINNMSLYILDDNMRPCPVWVVGEICIGGVGVARGYAGSEKLTNSRFVMYKSDEQVQDNRCNVRVHRSGDMGRYPLTQTLKSRFFEITYISAGW